MSEPEGARSSESSQAALWVMVVSIPVFLGLAFLIPLLWSTLPWLALILAVVATNIGAFLLWRRASNADRSDESDLGP